MKKKMLFTLFVFASICTVGQAQINGIVFSNTWNTGKDTLLLNGSGTRDKYWMDMYVAGLYLTAKNKDANSIIAMNSPMAIKLHIVSGLITSSRMTEAVDEGFSKSTGGNTAPIKDKIEKFKNAFSEEIKKGDVFDVIYSAETIWVYKNNVLKTQIGGLDFKKAVFGIWLGSDPADNALKNGMLGIIN